MNLLVQGFEKVRTSQTDGQTDATERNTTQHSQYAGVDNDANIRPSTKRHHRHHHQQ